MGGLQIGIMRADRDSELDNFPAIAYSPSLDYMYTSPSAGPDFSGLFSVARNVYQRQVFTHHDPNKIDNGSLYLWVTPKINTKV